MTPGISTTGQASERTDRIAALIAARLAATRTSFARGTHAGDASFDDLVRAGMSAALRFGMAEATVRGQAMR